MNHNVLGQAGLNGDREVEYDGEQERTALPGSYIDFVPRQYLLTQSFELPKTQNNCFDGSLHCFYYPQ
jgi:hypothetical protein